MTAKFVLNTIQKTHSQVTRQEPMLGIVRMYLSNALLGLSTVKYPHALNETHIVLIPKKDKPCCISTCTPLHCVMRLITNNIMVAFELIHHMNNTGRGRVGEVAMNIDIILLNGHGLGPVVPKRGLW
ncbi:hypothetical protein GOBAR_AA26298 [Gossypium barbadense]|uniref:Uncharacterized protein n=1 Tax=Gossypium barbadense TaxID=3634 RepID=A0A2P5WTF9_GOSBA|nr:hypothetical protein GOBAR_AA26298 [Gossypium barbadense]